MAFYHGHRGWIGRDAARGTVMRYLVTGGQGLVGRSVVAALLSRPDTEVVSIGRSPYDNRHFTHNVHVNGELTRALLPHGMEAHDPSRFRYESLDITNTAAVCSLLELSAPDTIVHLASGLRDDEPGALVHVNILGTVSLFQAIERSAAKRPRVILGSSGSVYGPVASDRLPIREEECCTPIDPYAVSKRAGEDFAAVLGGSAGVPVVIARIFNVVGPGQEERHVCGRFAAQLAAICSGAAPPVMEVGDLRPTRDFIDVRDVAAAIITLAAASDAAGSYNLASGREVSIATILEMLVALAGCGARMRYEQRYVRQAEISRVYADITRLRRLGYEPRFTLEESLRDVLGYYTGVMASAAG